MAELGGDPPFGVNPGDNVSIDETAIATGDLARTEAERLRSAEFTLATIRDHAGRATATVGGNDHAQGYGSAMRDVLAILDARWLPEGEPVIFS